MVGGVIGNYRILRRIGEGGMGAVYLAEHALIGRQAAIKVLLREMSWRQDVVTRFFNEARAATAVKHPGIVEIYDFGYHTDGSAYIVMEYLVGESLSVRLQRTRVLSEARASALCRQIAGALGAAHAKGIVHRDLKPDNIYIVRDPDIADGERTKILDFGIAKLTAAELPGQSVTRTGSVVGTPPYMSPEQCKGAGAVDHRADLYALGCILFEMVCGRLPFVAEGGGEIMAQHIYAPVPLPSSLAAVTPRLERVVLRALAKEPSQRFQSADEVIAALQGGSPSGLLHGGMSAPMAVMTPSSPGQMPRHPTPRQPIPALPKAAAVIAIAPQQTTLSQASASTLVVSTASDQRRSRRVPAIALALLAVGAMAITLGMCRGERDERLAAATEPAPAAPKTPAETNQPPPPGAVATPAPSSAAALETTPSTSPAAKPASPAGEVAMPGAPDAQPAAPVATLSAPAVTPAPRRITLRLTSDPAAADVYLMPRGVRIGKTPFDYKTDAGAAPVALTFKKAGYSDKQTSVPSDRDGEHEVTFARIAVRSSPPTPSTSTGPGSGSADAAPKSSLDPFEKLAPTTRRNQ